MSEANVLPRFHPGQIVSTAAALNVCSPDYLAHCLWRHLSGDWGCIPHEDRESNDEALQEGLRILSAYPLDPAKRCQGFGENTLWVITEADRSTTTFLLPEEY